MTNPFGNIGNIMKQAKEMQDKLKEIQDQMAALQVIGEAGGGMVKLLVNGNGDALNIKFDEEAYKDPQVLRQLILAAINDANHKRELKKKEAMTNLMSSMGLPPGFDMSQITGE